MDARTESGPCLVLCIRRLKMAHLEPVGIRLIVFRTSAICDEPVRDSSMLKAASSRQVLMMERRHNLSWPVPKATPRQPNHQGVAPI